MLQKQIDEPEADFVRFFFYATNPGARFTSHAKEQFTEFVKIAYQQVISERINDRLRSALRKEEEAAEKQEEEVPLSNKGGIVTTEDELEGFNIVRAIVCQAIHLSRIFHRDTKSYFGILIDDNNRKPICRLHFNSAQKSIGIIGTIELRSNTRSMM